MKFFKIIILTLTLFLIALIIFLQFKFVGLTNYFPHDFISIVALKVPYHWNEYGIFNMRFAQFLGNFKFEKETIFNCLNQSVNYCPQNNIAYHQIPYVSFPPFWHIPVFILKKIFSDTDLKVLSDILLIMYYLLTSLILTKISLQINKSHLIENNINYMISFIVFIIFYINSNLFDLYSSLYITETFETIFIALYIFFRFKIFCKIKSKNILLFNLSFLFLSFHTYFAYLLLVFDALISLICDKKNFKITIKYNFTFFLLSLFINFGVIFTQTYEWDTIFKIFYRSKDVSSMQLTNNFFYIFLNNFLLSIFYKVLIFVSFLITVFNIFKNKNRLISIIFLPYFLSCSLYFFLFTNYHLLHDYFAIKFYILSILGLITITKFIKEFCENLFLVNKFRLYFTYFLLILFTLFYLHKEINEILAL